MTKLAALMLILCLPAHAEHHHHHTCPVAKKMWTTFAEHVSLGAGTEIAVSQAAGGANHYFAGLAAVGIVAAVKEGSDVVAGRDTKQRAAWHAFSIALGGGVSAAAWHDDQDREHRKHCHPE